LLVDNDFWIRHLNQIQERTDRLNTRASQTFSEQDRVRRLLQDQMEATRVMSDQLNNQILPEVDQNIESARLILHTGWGNFELFLNKTYILGGLGIAFLIIGGM
jgi:DNA-binding MurR/RpiR family transcriptional regulator